MISSCLDEKGFTREPLVVNTFYTLDYSVHGQLLRCMYALLIWIAAVAQRAEELRARQQEQRQKLTEEERRKVSPQAPYNPCGQMQRMTACKQVMLDSNAMPLTHCCDGCVRLALKITDVEVQARCDMYVRTRSGCAERGAPGG